MSFCLIISVQKHVMTHDVCLNGEGCLTARAVTYGVFTGGGGIWLNTVTSSMSGKERRTFGWLQSRQYNNLLYAYFIIFSVNYVIVRVLYSQNECTIVYLESDWMYVSLCAE